MNGLLPASLASVSAAAFVLAATTRLDVAVRRLRDPSPGLSDAVDGSHRMLALVRRHRLVRRLIRLDRLETLLSASGTSVSLADLMRIKVVAGSALVLVLGAADLRLFPIALIAGAGAFVAPDIVIARQSRGLRRMADLETPQFLDLLAAASSAGLSGPAAVRRATAGLRGPLAEALAAATSAVDAGARWRDELRDLASRLQLPDLAAAVAVVARSERLGSSLAANLRDLASEVRESRRARAAELARTAPVKMLFPLVFMVLPAFLLLTVAPVLIATIRSLD